MSTTLETLFPHSGREIVVYDHSRGAYSTTLNVSSHVGDDRFEPTPFYISIETDRETHSIWLDRERAKDVLAWLGKALAE